MGEWLSPKGNKYWLYLSGTCLLILTLTHPTHGRPLPQEEEDFNTHFFDSQRDPSPNNGPERMIVRVIVTSSSSSSSSSDSQEDSDNATFHDFEFPLQTTPTSTTTTSPTTPTTTPKVEESPGRKDVEDIFSAFYKAFPNNANANNGRIAGDASQNVERFQLFYPHNPTPSIFQRFRVDENKDLTFGGRREIPHELKVTAVSSSSSTSHQKSPPTTPTVKTVASTSFSSSKRHHHHQNQRHCQHDHLPGDRRRRRNRRQRHKSQEEANGPVVITVSSSSSTAIRENPPPLKIPTTARPATTPSPLKSWQQPEKVWGEPEKVWDEPAKIWGDSAKIWGQPEQNWGHSPKPTTRRPRFTPRKSRTFPPPRDEDYPRDSEALEEAPGSFVILGEEDPSQDSIDGSFDHHLGLPPLSPRPLSPDHFRHLRNFTFKNFNLSLTPASNFTPPTTFNETTPPGNFGYVLEGSNVRRYRVEERTPDGYIVGEYGVLNNQNAFLRGVRYTADSTINPRLIHEALMKFLALRRRR